MEEIVEVDSTEARSAAHRGADCPRPRPAGRGRNSESGPDHSQESISNRIIDRIIDVPSCETTSSIVHPDGAEDVGSSSDSAPLVQQAQKTVEMPSSSSSTRWLKIP